MKSYPYHSRPTNDLFIDVIIPFWEGDKQFLGECLSAICQSNYIQPIIHLVADGCLFPEKVFYTNGLHTHELHSDQTLDPTIHKYFTPGGWGPYRIVNALVSHLVTPYFAIQDVDDLSLPNRLWKQRLCLNDYMMTTCAMKQEPTAGYKGNRHTIEPVIYPGTKFSTTPYGRVINSTRSMRLSVFKELNGFADMFCSGDFQFDNRILPLYEAHSSPEILGVRRLHPKSISNGREAVFPGMNRAKFVNEIKQAIALMKSPTLEKARSLGALDRAKELTRIQ